MQQALIRWASVHGRRLPWRDTRDPWAVLVSELMLQQTQVARVVPKWHAFLDRFPSPAACAAAPVADVIDAWSGLGYNRRAVNLHRAACSIGAGPFPSSYDALVALPGVGPYTARAVLVFAFEADTGVVEVNTARVLARTAGELLPAAALQRRADALVPAGAGWAWNQAMLDLGATVCLRKTPLCGLCPVRRRCAWHRDGGPDPAAAATRQSRFTGSDRQGRGRLVHALRSGPVATSDLAAVMGWPDDPDRAGRVAAGVVADGLAVCDGAVLTLPG